MKIFQFSKQNRDNLFDASYQSLRKGTELSYSQDPSIGTIPKDLVVSIRDLYEPAGIKVTSLPMPEPESSEYGACRLGLNGRMVAYRIAKTTPTKVGQFVTIWKRAIPHDEIAPLDQADGIDLVVISVFDSTHRGQFIFDQKILVEKNIMSRNGRGGKRAIRVYPPWVKTQVKQAITTQQWQLRYFLQIQPENSDLARVRNLFGC